MFVFEPTSVHLALGNVLILCFHCHCGEPTSFLLSIRAAASAPRPFFYVSFASGLNYIALERFDASRVRFSLCLLRGGRRASRRGFHFHIAYCAKAAMPRAGASITYRAEAAVPCAGAF